MEIKNLLKYGTAEKIVLAEQLWDSISKNQLKISDETKKELARRLENLENGNTKLYSLNKIKTHLKTLR